MTRKHGIRSDLRVKKTTFGRRLSSGLLALLMTFSVGTGLFTQTASAEESSAVSNPLDFSDKSSSLVAQVIAPSQLLLYVVEDEVSETESAYLDTMTDWRLLYHARIPQTTVRTQRDGEQLKVYAEAYEYVAQNGMTVRFVPVTMDCVGELRPMIKEEDGYVAVLEASPWATPRISIQFEAEITIPRALMETLVNLAYTDATEAVEATRVYEEALAAYEAAVEAYETYQEEQNAYEIALVSYQAYLTAYAKYETAVRERQAYEEAYAVYEERLNAYETYLAQLAAYEEAEKTLPDRIAANEKQQADYEAYQAYLAEIEKRRELLDLFEMVYVRSATGKQMYATLLGPTVTSVISKREELIEYGGVSEKDIDNAGESTDILRALLTEYKEIKKDADKYAWYTENYVALRDNFTLLCSSLSSLFESHVVKAGLKNEGKLDRYCEFVAHLYVISTCLDDSMTTDPSWKINRKKLDKVLEAEYVTEDRNMADPRELPWPDEVAKVEKPEPIVMPPYPSTVVTKPIAPIVVPEAGDPPAVVAEPQKPTVCEEPGARPEAPHLSGALTALIPWLQAGQLQPRELSFEGDLTVTLKTQATMLPVFEQEADAILYFFDARGQLLDFFSLTEGGWESMSLPTRESDEQYHYTFIGWGDQSGRLIDVNALTETTELYPVYEKSARTYTVTFSTHQGDVTREVAYGDMPTYGEEIPGYTENGSSYVFAGWDKALIPVTGDVVYTARYKEAKTKYTVTWKIGDTTLKETYEAGEIPVCPVEPALSASDSDMYYNEFIGWDPELRSVEADAVYTALFSRTLLLPVNDFQTGLPVTEKSAAYTAVIPAETERLSLSALLALSEQAGKGILLTFEDGYTVELDVDLVKSLAEAKADVLTVSHNRENSLAFSFDLRNEDGEALAADGMRVSLLVSLAEQEMLFAYASRDGVAFDTISSFMNGDQAVIVVEGGYTHYLLTVDKTYGITVSPCEGGVVTLDRYLATEGDVITISPMPGVGYEAVSVLVKGAERSFEVLPDENGQYIFTMPQEAVEIDVTFALKRLTVAFYVDGELYHSAEFTFGDELILPQNPTKSQEGDTVFTFAGWSPNVSKTVMADATYEAVFKQSVLASVDNFPQSPYTQVVPVKLILIATGVLALGAGATTAVILWRQKRKAALKAKSTDKSTDA